MVADAAFGRPERAVVLHAIAGKDLDLAVVHLDGTRDDNLPPRVGEDPPDTRLEVEHAGRSVELLEHSAEDRSIRCHDPPCWSARGPAAEQTIIMNGPQTICESSESSLPSRASTVMTEARKSLHVPSATRGWR